MIPPKTATVKLGENTFVLQQLTGMQSHLLQTTIAPSAMAALALWIDLLRDVIVQGFDPKQELTLAAVVAMDIDVDKYFGRAAQVIAKLSPAALELATRTLFTGATVDGKLLFAPVQGDGDYFNEIMRGRSRDVDRLLWEAVRLNYPDFIPALGASAARTPGASPSEASTTSPTSGPPTAS